MKICFVRARVRPAHAADSMLGLCALLHFTRPPYREVVRCRRCSPVRARWGLGLGLGMAVAFPCPLTSSLSWWLRPGFPAVLLQPGRGKPAALENTSFFETRVPPPLFVLPIRVCRHVGPAPPVRKMRGSVVPALCCGEALALRLTKGADV